MSTDDGPDGPEGAVEWDIVDLIPDPEGAFMVAETRPPQAAANAVLYLHGQKNGQKVALFFMFYIF